MNIICNIFPTTRNINSSKNNSLPSWDRYFNALGDLEYRAYDLRGKNEAVAKEFAEKFAQNNILFYDPGQTTQVNCISSQPGGNVGGSNVNYAGVQVFSDADMQVIEANQPIYQEAADKYNFPWQVLAILHNI